MDPAEVKDSAIVVEQVETLRFNLLISMRITPLSEILIAVLLVSNLHEVFAFEQVVYIGHVNVALADLAIYDQVEIIAQVLRRLAHYLTISVARRI